MSDIGNYVFVEALQALSYRIPILNTLMNSAIKNASSASASYQQEFNEGYTNAKGLSTDELAEKLKNRKSDSPMMKGMALEYMERTKKK